MSKKVNEPLTKGSGLSIALSVMISMFLIIIVVGIFYWIQQIKIEKIEKQMDKSNEAVLDQFAEFQKQYLENIAAEEEEEKIIDYTNLTYRIVDSWTENQKLVSIDFEGKQTVLMDLSAWYESAVSFEVVGLVGNDLLLKMLTEADCPYEIKYFKYNFDENKLNSGQEVNYLGMFSGDNQYYAYVEQQVEDEQIMESLMIWDVVNNKIEEVEKLTVEQTLVMSQECNKCELSKINFKWQDPQTLSYTIYELGEEFECNLKENLGEEFIREKTEEKQIKVTDLF